jgi:hypothetical protein
MRISRWIYQIFAWLFTVGVMVQVFLAGMVVVAVRMGWDAHVSLGHILAGPLIVMLITMYTGKLPGRMKRLNWLLFLNYLIQADVVIFLRSQAPVVSALHPVLALIDFALGYYLARQAAVVLRESTGAAATIQPGSAG